MTTDLHVLAAPTAPAAGACPHATTSSDGWRPAELVALAMFGLLGATTISLLLLVLFAR
jgi:hypothetical protein